MQLSSSLALFYKPPHWSTSDQDRSSIARKIHLDHIRVDANAIFSQLFILYLRKVIGRTWSMYVKHTPIASMAVLPEEQ